MARPTSHCSVQGRAGAYGSAAGTSNRAGRQKSNPGPYSAQMDVFTEAVRNIGGTQSLWPAGAGYPHFGFTNSVMNNVTNTYYTESGMRLFRIADGTWNIQTTAGVTVANLPDGVWATWETEPVMSATTVVSGVDATTRTSIAFQHRVWSIDHTILYGSLTVDEYQGSAEYRFLGGPRNQQHALRQRRLGRRRAALRGQRRLGPPDRALGGGHSEPASLALLGLGSVLMLRRRAKA